MMNNFWYKGVYVNRDKDRFEWKPEFLEDNICTTICDLTRILNIKILYLLFGVKEHPELDGWYMWGWSHNPYFWRML